MTDFLNFLNTADSDTLTQISDITPAIASNLIKARPFEDVNDCLKVRGMKKNLLAQMQSAFEAGENVTESRAMIPVKEEAAPIWIGKSQPAQESDEEKSTFLSRLGQAFMVLLRAFVKLLMLVLLIVVIGAGLSYGLPYINKTFIVPVEENTAHVNQLEDEVANLQAQLDEMNSRIGLVETSIETHSASLKKLEKMQAAIESELEQNNTKTLLKLKHEITITRALDNLGRARLYLAQSNFGMAREDVKSARDLLGELQAETNDKLLGQVIERLDLALGNLPAFPVVASGDLEIAWQLLMTGAPVNPIIATPSPEPLPTFTPTVETLTTPASTTETPPTGTATAKP